MEDRRRIRTLESVGGGKVLESEHDDGDGAEGAAYEVEVERPDGSQVEVYVDDQFNALGNAVDDEAPGEDDDAGEDDD